MTRAPQGQGSFLPTTELATASPSMMFTYFLFHRWDVFLDAMMKPGEIDIDMAITTLLSTCPESDRREKFLSSYQSLKEKTGSQTTAAVLVSGDFFAYVAEACDFIEKSYGGAC